MRRAACCPVRLAMRAWRRGRRGLQSGRYALGAACCPVHLAARGRRARVPAATVGRVPARLQHQTELRADSRNRFPKAQVDGIMKSLGRRPPVADRERYRHPLALGPRSDRSVGTRAPDGYRRAWSPVESTIRGHLYARCPRSVCGRPAVGIDGGVAAGIGASEARLTAGLVPQKGAAGLGRGTAPGLQVWPKLIARGRQCVTEIRGSFAQSCAVRGVEALPRPPEFTRELPDQMAFSAVQGPAARSLTVSPRPCASVTERR